ncbi:MAG: 3-dehydroquinate synthase [Thermoguttaceae bacterium]
MGENSLAEPGASESGLTSVRVELGPRSYDIWIGSHWMERFGGAIRPVAGTSPNAMVFTSPRIGALHYQPFADSLASAGFTNVRRHDIPDGEDHKTLEEFAKGVRAIASCFPDTEVKPVVFNLGGGIVSDVGGFIAGTYWRGNGIRYVQVPTTLLACVDCSVGGKTGVNVDNVKNQAGLFCQPHLVLVDLAFLDTLDDAEMRSGLAEVIKYGMVCDVELFELLEAHATEVLQRTKDVLHAIVTKCCRIKAQIVEDDERDLSGNRMRLNFGHTIGHAIETASNFAFRHGEAVAIGMLGATRLAVRLNLCEQALQDRFASLIRRAGLPATAAGAKLDLEQVLSAMALDKKFAQGVNCFVLPTRLGEARLERDVPDELVREAVGSCLVP